MSSSLSRRDFLVGSAATAASVAIGGVAIGGVACATPRGAASPNGGVRSLARGAVKPGIILFQGDSITDTGRNKTNAAPNAANALGNGYPLLISSAILAATPNDAWRFFNRGISGNKIPDLTARWDTDTVALKPDVLSILIGVNDYWHMRNGRYNGTLADFETGFDALLKSTRQSLPNTRLVILEPFVLVTGAVDASWHPDFDERRAAARRVADRAGATFVPLQAAFDAGAAQTGPAYWLSDGVHPTPAGHALIAEKWRAAVGI